MSQNNQNTQTSSGEPIYVARYLTGNEINEIITSLPKVEDQNKEAANKIEKSLVQQLSKIRIPPIYFEALKSIINRQFQGLLNKPNSLPFTIDIKPRFLTSDETTEIVTKLTDLYGVPQNIISMIMPQLTTIEISPLAIDELLQRMVNQVSSPQFNPNVEQFSFDINPRLLTQDEINDIISVIPKVRGADQDSAESVRRSIMIKLFEQLAEIIITPLAINDLKGILIQQFERSSITPGEEVGVLAAEALGQPITQMALNSFHTSGASKAITSGVDRIKELVNLTANPKNRSCSIYFKDPHLSFDDIILRKRADLVGLLASDLLISDAINSYDVDTPDNIIGDEQPWWYDIFESVIRDDFRQAGSQYILRLKLNVSALISYRVEMKDIAEAIERGDKDKPSCLICVYSPISEGIIDVYPIERVLQSCLKSTEGITTENASLIFLSTIVLPSLDKVQIKGVTGIRALYPINSPVLQIVKDEKIDDRDQNTWLIIINKIRVKVTGITPDYLANLCRVCGIEVLELAEEYQQDYLYVKMPNEQKPTELIKKIIDDDRKAEREYETEQRNKGVKYPRRPATEIELAANFVYADTDGSNLRTLLSRDDIDPTHTISNDVNEILSTLGIEAARNFLIREFIQVIAMEGSYVNPRHVTLLVEFMTNQGRLVPITYSGLQRQPAGALSKASFERSMDIFKEAAAFGRIEQAGNVSTSISIGQRAPLGTGFFDINIDQEVLSDYEQRIANEQAMGTASKVDVSELRDAISEIDNLNFGISDIVNQGSELEQMFSSTSEVIPSFETPSISVVKSQNKPVEPRPKQVVSQQLKNVLDTVQRAPCLNTETTTTISIQPVNSTVETTPIPSQNLATIQPQLPLTFNIPTTTTGVGLPSSLVNQIEIAQNAHLPQPLPPQPSLVTKLQPPLSGITKARRQLVPNQVSAPSLGSFLSTLDQ